MQSTSVTRSQNSKKRKTLMDQIVETLFKKLTEEDKKIACQFPLSENNLKKLCLKKRCIVQGDCANLLIGIEKKILLETPQLRNNSKKLLAKIYKWHKNHLKASKKYCERKCTELQNAKKEYWKENKVHGLISLGIHPIFLKISYDKYKNFDEATRWLKEFDLKYESNKLDLHSLSSRQSDETQSDISQITVINTQSSSGEVVINDQNNIRRAITNNDQKNSDEGVIKIFNNSGDMNTEELIGINEKSFVVQEYNLMFDSEEVIQTTSQNYEIFSDNGVIFTSTQKNY